MHSEPLPADISRRLIAQRELEWHESESQRRSSINKLLYGPPAFNRLIEMGMSFLREGSPNYVLDMACGEGKESLQLALLGLPVISVDLSHAQLRRARNLVLANDPSLEVYLIQANVERLPFADSAISSIYGKAILHHVDIGITRSEVLRVLKPSGRASFAEPMAHHPLFWLARTRILCGTDGPPPIILVGQESYSWYSHDR